jgi:CRP/FNR family cyclic AMP-dependent transcriptional regulator
MNITQRVEQLKSIAIFALLNESQLKLIAENITVENLKSGEVFIEQDTITDTAYLIINGAVKVYRITESGEEIMLDTKGSGEIVGEMALLDGKPRSAYVETIQDSAFFCINKNKFLDVVNKNPQISLNIIRHLILQIREFNERFEVQTSKNLTIRTYNTLKNISSYFPNSDITLSQEQLASIIGATRARVTECLNELERKGLLTLSHKKIHLN